MELAVGIIIAVLAVALVTCVLLQSGKDKRLSGAITGSADTYFGKGKGKSKDKLFSRITTVLSIVFVVLVVTMYIVVAKGI